MQAEKKEWDGKKIFDKSYQENYTREEKIAAFRESIAIRRHFGAYAKKRNFIVINNGVVEKRVDPDLPIPEGWQRGRVPRKGAI